MSRFLETLKHKEDQVPVWFMRQAGRYLPEYRKLRSSFPDFLSFCYTPEASTEATLQPIRRFGYDAAILFSDILVIPDALGQPVRYAEGHGPLLEAISTKAEIEKLDPSRVVTHLAPVFQTVKQIRRELPGDKALIGFAGAPWTVACYMVEGKGSKDFAKTRMMAYADEEAFALLMGILTESTVEYLSQQIEAGADAVQLFDSWAGVLPQQEFVKWVMVPAQKIVGALKAKHPDVPVIAFARGAGVMLENYADKVQSTALGIDTSMPMHVARDRLSDRFVLQGNLDPLVLASDRDRAVADTLKLLETMKGKAYIFNLGHGIIPQTPIDNVQAVIDTIHAFRG